MQPGTKQGPPGTKQGQPGTKQGQPGTKQGQPGTKKGQGHNWTNALQNCIGASIRIGREIQCLPYAGFFTSGLHNPKLAKLYRFFLVSIKK